MKNLLSVNLGILLAVALPVGGICIASTVCTSPACAEEGRAAIAAKSNGDNEVHVGPAHTATVITKLARGVRVTVDGPKTGDWYPVTLENGTHGWMHEHCVHFEKPEKIVEVAVGAATVVTTSVVAGPRVVVERKVIVDKPRRVKVVRNRVVVIRHARGVVVRRPAVREARVIGPRTVRSVVVAHPVLRSR